MLCIPRRAKFGCRTVKATLYLSGVSPKATFFDDLQQYDKGDAHDTYNPGSNAFKHENGCMVSSQAYDCHRDHQSAARLRRPMEIR